MLKGAGTNRESPFLSVELELTFSSCWKKYVLWSRQYRDVIVGHIYGHMNLDHFMLLDSYNKKGSGKSLFDPKHQLIPGFGQKSSDNMCLVEEFDPEADPEVSVSSAGNYLQSLREAFADVPTLGARTNDEDMEEYKKRIGGKWAERYVVANVGPSVVPNYFPTLRVFEYNITNLVDDDGTLLVSSGAESDPESEKKKSKKKPRKGKKPKTPDPPAKTAPPGPAYSVQPYTFLSYTQYFLNITKYNAIPPLADEGSGFRDELKKRDVSGDREEPRPKPQFEVEYDTKTESIYKLKDLTVRSYLKLARRIVDASSDRKKPKGGKDNAGALANEDNDGTEQPEDHMKTEDSGFDADKKKKHRKKPNPKADKVWHTFVKRAFVGTIGGTDLERFKVEREECGVS
jgi:endopolyphosphatase